MHWRVIAVSILALPSAIKFEKKLSKVPLLIKTATHKFDYVLHLPHFSATNF